MKRRSDPNSTSSRRGSKAASFPTGRSFISTTTTQPELADLIDAVPAHTVTIIRDPYDGFVSSYFTIQQHKDDGTA